MAATDIVINFLGNATGLNNASNSAASSLDKWAARAAKAGLVIAGALAGAATVAVKAAAEQSAAVSAWTQVTGKAMDEQQKVIARSLNLSQTDYAKSFTTLSSLYQSNGLSMKKANEMAAKGLKTAADQAAFGNTTVGEAVEAQAGLLKGSGELLEKYAISITAADVAARLKADGNDKLKGSELKVATAMAKANLVQEQSAKFAGQASREANSLESRQQKLSATIEDFKAKLGAGLLPVVQEFVGKLQLAADWVEKNEGKAKLLAAGLGILAGVLISAALVLKAVALAQMVSAAATAVMTGGWTLLATVMWANPVFIIAGIILAIGAALVIAYKKSETFRTVVNAAFQGVKAFVIDALQILSGAILGFWGMIINGAAKAFGWMPGIGDKLKAAADKFNAFKDGVAKGLRDLEGPHFLEIDVDATKANAKLDKLQLKMSNISHKDLSGPQIASGQRGGAGGITARAIGGPVEARRTYLVGERGPELFSPKSGGTITPNHVLAAASAGPDVLNLTLDLGHGIRQVVAIDLREQARATKRTVNAGGRRTV